MEPLLPRSFIESALPTRKEYEASLTLPDNERAKLEASYLAPPAQHAGAVGIEAFESSGPPIFAGKKVLSIRNYKLPADLIGKPVIVLAIPDAAYSSGCTQIDS